MSNTWAPSHRCPRERPCGVSALVTPPGMSLPDGMAAAIDRNSPERMYDQLARILTEQIRSQGLRVGDALPGEFNLCAAFDVSRTVVRQALAALEDRGIVQRVRGKGTFVGDGKMAEHFVYSLSGLFDEVASRGGTVRSDVLRQEWTRADTATAAALDVRVGARVPVLERLRFVDGEAWSWTSTWLRPDLAPLVLGVDMTDASLYGLLADAGVRLTTGRRSVEAAVATPEQARLLRLDPGEAVMILTSISSDARGVPVEYFVAYHRGRRSRFEFDLRAESAPAS